MNEGSEDRAARAVQRTARQVTCLRNPTRHEIDAHRSGGRFVWVDLEDPSDADLDRLTEHIPLHPLTLGDARTFGRRPKIEDHDSYVFIVVCGVDADTESGGRLLREVHLIVTDDAVVTIHQHPDAGLASLRERCCEREVRSEQFLICSILDTVLSTFEPVLGRIDDDIDSLEEQIIDKPRESELQRIFSIKRDLVAMRRVVTPMRDMLLRRADRLTDLTGLDRDDKLYFRDLYEGLIRTSDQIDSYRDLLAGATDLYLSTVANRQGEVNRQLTIIATVFLPLTFFTGFFGQNFSLLTTHIINHGWSFWVFGVGLMVVSTLGFYVYFRRKGWIGPDATDADV